MADPKQPVFVTVSALDAGHITLPERLFITEADPEKANLVPSLSFLIQHPSASPSREGSRNTNLVFDLGVKRDLDAYTPSQSLHTNQRKPIIVDPDCAKSLRKGSLEPGRDIDFVIISHVHWDHVGTPSDFASATFAVGSGTLDLLKNGAGPLYPADLFNDDELPADRTVEFPPVAGTRGYEFPAQIPRHTEAPANSGAKLPAAAKQWAWQQLGDFPNALDFFGDGSVWVIDTPGHLYGHVNLLARIGEHKYIYLGGDCCHDSRILSGQTGIAMYADGMGGMRSVHVDTPVATKTLERIRAFAKAKDGGVDVEVVLAHDADWRNRNGHRFWPGRL